MQKDNNLNMVKLVMNNNAKMFAAHGDFQSSKNNYNRNTRNNASMSSLVNKGNSISNNLSNNLSSNMNMNMNSSSDIKKKKGPRATSN